MSAFRKGLVGVTATSVLGMSLVFALGAKADGIADFNIGNTHVCIGLSSCLFKPQTYGGRDADNVRDHRGKTSDHRAERKNTVVPAKVGVRVRDHRRVVVVRDHRTERKNEVVTIPKLDCRVGHERLRRSGYDDIVINDCKAPQYTYTARMGTGIFRAQMHAYSGTITATFLGIIAPNNIMSPNN